MKLKITTIDGERVNYPEDEHGFAYGLAGSGLTLKQAKHVKNALEAAYQQGWDAKRSQMYTAFQE